MTTTEFFVQVSAAIAGPAALAALATAAATYREIREQTEKNTTANFGSDDPHNPWPGTVPLVSDHEGRLAHIEDVCDIEPPEPPRSRNWARFAADGGKPPDETGHERQPNDNEK